MADVKSYQVKPPHSRSNYAAKLCERHAQALRDRKHFLLELRVAETPCDMCSVFQRFGKGKVTK